MNRSITAFCAACLSFCVGMAAASSVEYSQAVMAGLKMTVEEAEALEERLATDAGDLNARTQLIVYHHRNVYSEASSGVAHSGHVLWLIRNAPRAAILGTPHAKIFSHRDADGYIAGKDAWASHLEREPTNVTFLGHAASFYWPFEDRNLKIETLEKVQSLDPANAEWPTELGQLYLREAAIPELVRYRLQIPDGFDPDDPRRPAAGVSEPLERRSAGQASIAGRALEHLRRAYELAGSDPERTYLLEGLAEAAFRAGQYGDAQTYADAMLTAPTMGRNDESHIHKANIVLGQLALAEDDVVTAKHHLLAAGKVSGAPTLGSFGPNMQLAAELLERGEREVVLEYFELCSNFWPSDKLKDWAALVKGGRTPDFGANLVY